MQKECGYVIMLKIALLLVKIYVLVGKKGISGLVSQVAPKPTALKLYLLSESSGLTERKVRKRHIKTAAVGKHSLRICHLLRSLSAIITRG